MPRGHKCISGKKLSDAVKDLHLDDVKHYLKLVDEKVLPREFPKSIYCQTAVNSVHLFHEVDYVSIETFVNMVKTSLFDKDQVNEFQKRYPKFIPSNWNEYYGLTATDCHELDNPYPEGVKMAEIIKSIHDPIFYDEDKIYDEPESNKFFQEDFNTYKKVIIHLIENKSYNKPLIESILGDEIYKFDSINNYLIFDGVIEKTETGYNLIASGEKMRFILGLLNNESHPVNKGLKGHYRINSYEYRLNEYKTMTEINEMMGEVDQATQQDSENYYNDLNLDLSKVDDFSSSFDNYEVHLDGLVIQVNKNDKKRITIEGNKIIIQ